MSLRTCFRWMLVVIVSGWLVLPGIAQDQPTSEQTAFDLAPGYTFEPIALAPLIKWPVLVDWDSKGHLLVVESGGVAHPIIEHNQQGLHRLVRLIDENGDGVMDRRELVTDRLPFTEGVLCLGSSILVSAPPVIYELSDADGDGYCEQREIWFDGQTLTGCANDLHGPYLGRDGWVYWCKGAFAEQKHELLSGGLLADKAAHIYRRKLSGGPIEPVMSGGMDNPVGFAILPNGERFFSSTFLVHPGDGLRDGVVHSIYGGTYGKDHAALEGVVRTGDLMPVMVHLGPAAPSGMICLSEGLQSNSASGTLVVTLFNHRKLIALELEDSGATYRTQPQALVTGNRIDFHPTDVLRDMDGSLVVVDTGGWYDLCCPSSRVDQDLASGGIYRLMSPQLLQHDAASHKSPRAIEFTPERAVELLDDSRPWIARRALLQIAQSGDKNCDVLKSKIQNPQNKAHSRRNALWALGATGSQSALGFVTKLIAMSHLPREGEQSESESQTEQELSHIACHLVSLYRYEPAKENLEQILRRFISDDFKNSTSEAQIVTPSLARVSVEALGRIGDSKTVELLLESFHRLQDDRILDHSIRYALFELNEASAVAQFLDNPSPKLRELALSTLDLLKHDTFLTADRLVSAARNEVTQATAIRLLLNRPQLSADVIQRLGTEWSRDLHSASPPASFVQLAKGWRNEEAIQVWLGDKLSAAVATATENGQPINHRLWEWIQAAMDSHAGQPIPGNWHDWIAVLLHHHPERTAQALHSIGLESESQLPLVRKIVDLLAASNDDSLRQQLLMCLPAKHLVEDPLLVTQQVDGLLNRTQSSPTSGSSRNEKWAILERLKVDRQNAGRILELIPQLSTNELLLAIETIASVGSEELDRQLLTQLPTLRTARGLPSGSLLNVYRNHPESLRRLTQETSDELSKSDPDIEQQVQAILEILPAGDPVRGLELYHGSKVNCGGCHQMGYLGGKVGPELSKIGRSRTREALLEAILFPNERIEQGFQATQVLTVDGRIINGLPTNRNTSQLLELRVTADRVENIAVEEIEEARPSDISIMPGGMMDLLSHQELADLLSLLEAAK